MKLSDIPEGVTRLLQDWSSGNEAALDEILGLVYGRLREEARRQLGRSRYKDQLVQPTQLVHEAYVKFREENHPRFADRSDFEWFASRIIRNVLVDHIRTMNRQKRKAKEMVPLDEERDGFSERQPGKLDPETFLDIAKAMDRLEAVNPRQCQIVALRFIMGRSIAETAEVMGLSSTTVKKEWQAAQIWLFKRLNHGSGTVHVAKTLTL